MPRLTSPSSRALAGLVLAACSVYDVPNRSPTESEGGSGGKDGAMSGNATTAAGGTNVAGSTNGGAASAATGGTEPMPAGGAPDTSTIGGAGADGDPMPGAAGAGGVADVVDECPDDQNKTAPGICGCGLPDVATELLASCKNLTSKLLHRYDFEGTGTSVTDRAGASHGMLMGGATLSKLSGRGVVQLAGGSTGGYVDLPNGLISSLSNATLESWITWGGGNSYQRVFDFGDSDSATPEDNPQNGKTYLFVSPKADDGVATLGYSLMGSGQDQVAVSNAALPQALTQVVAVVDATGDMLRLYVDGVQVGTRAWTGALSSINDVNAWLGRSQYNGDPELTATFHEFRVYGAALGATEIATAFKAGADPAFMPQ